MTENAARWANLVAQWRASGKAVAEFAIEKSISPTKLKWWSCRLPLPANESQKMPAIAMARVVPTGRAASVGLSVNVGGATIAVDRGFDAELLREVVRALGEAR